MADSWLFTFANFFKHWELDLDAHILHTAPEEKTQQLHSMNIFHAL